MFFNVSRETLFVYECNVMKFFQDQSILLALLDKRYLILNFRYFRHSLLQLLSNTKPAEDLIQQVHFDIGSENLPQ